MKRVYGNPTVTDFGDISDVTGIFGGVLPGDVLVNTTGQIVQEGPTSIDACAKLDFESCHVG